MLIYKVIKLIIAILIINYTFRLHLQVTLKYNLESKTATTEHNVART